MPPPSCVCCCRYSRDGPLLWPKAQAPQPLPCPSCGGPRVFEVQLMPALSQVVLEAAGMAAEQGLAVDADGEPTGGEGASREYTDLRRLASEQRAQLRLSAELLSRAPDVCCFFSNHASDLDPVPVLRRCCSGQRCRQLGVVHSGGVHVPRQLQCH